jgi:para-nitrobenzyl esterase
VGTPWQLASITLVNPAVSCEVPEAVRASYTLQLAADGTFAAKADCKDVSGSYTSSESGTLQLIPGPVTTVACPPGSFSDLYISGLGKVNLWAITSNLLVLSDSAGDSLTFEPKPQ